jgi:peptidoglycan/xylan/chitin deacetylase (PgdA/CDA1 family)
MRRIPILLYHHILGPNDQCDPYSVTSDRFESQLSLLAKTGWRTIGLNDWMEHHLSGKTLPDRSFALTFDDGHLDNRTHAFPILQRLGFMATIFLTVDSIESGRDNFGSIMLGWNDVETMLSAGFEFQSHGILHRRLTTLSVEDARDDIVRSKQVLENRLGRTVNFFAYPFGDFNPTIQSIVSEAGYLGACGGVPEWDGGLFDSFAIGRTEIYQQDGIYRFTCKLRTGYSWALYIRKYLGRWRRRVTLIKIKRRVMS